MSFIRRSSLSARSSSRGGFTLVELLVVIAIIALLASVALPAITGALKKAKENAALQTAHGLGLALFEFATDNDGTFPGSQPTATPPITVGNSEQAYELLIPSYLSNADTLWIAGAGGGKYTGSTPTSGLTASNVSWDYTVREDGTGATSNDPDQLPLAISTGSTIGTYGSGIGNPGAVTTSISSGDSATNPFGSDGVAVGYKDMSSRFVVEGNAGANGQPFAISSASFTPVTTYKQLKP